MIMANNQKKEEPRCPFYNLVLYPDSNHFFTLDKDLCSLLFPHADSASIIDKGLCGLFAIFPFCTMKEGDFEPNWDFCLNKYNQMEHLKNIADNYNVFSEEKGKFVKFDEWFQDVMGYSVYKELEPEKIN